mmetsp:Transcript_51761/g.117759  ORF Transcript_51761/g.117759 Transcript_51761/m.117759 type:complete len:238 (+) Transcript_51761:270-983(+)
MSIDARHRAISRILASANWARPSSMIAKSTSKLRIMHATNTSNNVHNLWKYRESSYLSSTHTTRCAPRTLAAKTPTPSWCCPSHVRWLFVKKQTQRKRLSGARPVLRAYSNSASMNGPILYFHVQLTNRFALPTCFASLAQIAVASETPASQSLGSTRVACPRKSVLCVNPCPPLSQNIVASSENVLFSTSTPGNWLFSSGTKLFARKFREMPDSARSAVAFAVSSLSTSRALIRAA